MGKKKDFTDGAVIRGGFRGFLGELIENCVAVFKINQWKNMEF